MKQVEKVENLLAGWLKPLPHLPVSFTKWVAANIWWIVFVGVILSVISTLFMIGALFTIISLLGASTSFYGYYIAPAYTIWSVLASVVSIIFMVATVVLSAMAISPLKISRKKGWTLLFLVLLIQAVSAVVGAILSFSIVGFITGVIFGAIGVAISAYCLYEIRSYFGSGVKAAVATEIKL